MIPLNDIERIKQIVAPIAEKHGVEKVWLFAVQNRSKMQITFIIP